MIGYLEGNVKVVRLTHCIILVGGVGYKVFATKDYLLTLKPDSPAAFWTHLAVREDILDLYGFSDEAALRFFELLLTVSGIGPKSALAILDIASVETLRSAISTGRAEYLTKVSGIGKKTAEKIVLELREKVGAGDAGTSASLKGDEEALEALKALGYSASEARDTLRKVPAEFKNANDRLREALKLLGGR
ncbi:Holliday junction branch migration protein RuvA [Candidatus Kaiserbacteria bacterium]|nr:Holliday junction branch migration protein RuvA [Candidatus Kaiserbacteria bacterium]